MAKIRFKSTTKAHIIRFEQFLLKNMYLKINIGKYVYSLSPRQYYSFLPFFCTSKGFQLIIIYNAHIFFAQFKKEKNKC
jgi:hypothetical protein